MAGRLIIAALALVCGALGSALWVSRGQVADANARTKQQVNACVALMPKPLRMEYESLEAGLVNGDFSFPPQR